MIKEVPCMDCDGKGFIAIFSEYSVWSERCQNCGGTGIVKVPMTNADRIRAMSDEELSDIFLRADFCKCCEHEKDGVCNYICAYPNIPLYDGCKQAALAWMKQPVEVDT